MIVECSECQTRFQLDDARIPASGIRVRCSRCKHAFFLQPGEGSQSEAIHAVAEEAAAAGGASPPGATQDLPGAALTDSGVPEAAGAVAGEDEDDWEFNEEIPAPEPESASAFEADPSALPGLDGSAEEPSGSEEASAFGADDLLDERSGGGDDGVPALADPEPPAAPEPEAADGPTAAAVSEEGGLDTFGTVDELGDLAEDEPVAADPGLEGKRGAFGSDDLDDPESWDFFAEAEAARQAVPPSALPAAAAREAAPTRRLEEDGLPELGPVAPVRSEAERWLRRAGSALGWAASLGLAVVALGQGIVPESARSPQRPDTLEVPGWSAGDLDTRWVESARQGPLLVLEASLRHRGDAPRALDPLLRAELVDRAGRPIEEAPVRASLSSPLSETALRELSREELEQARAAARSRLDGTPFRPGEARRVQAVLAEVPAEAAQIVLRRLDPQTEAPRTETPGAGSQPANPQADLASGPQGGVGTEAVTAAGAGAPAPADAAAAGTAPPTTGSSPR